jgi:hypothetical protein
VMGHPVLLRLPNPPAELPSKIAAWKRIATTVREHALNPPHRRQWLCIHHFEGAWNDPGPPYYGGLQIDHAKSASNLASSVARTDADFAP